MITWASVIYNDILGPFRKETSEKMGLLINRMIVALIGVFLFFSTDCSYKLEGGLSDCANDGCGICRVCLCC